VDKLIPDIIAKCFLLILQRRKKVIYQSFIRKDSKPIKMVPKQIDGFI